MSIDLVLSTTELTVGATLKGSVKILELPHAKANCLYVYFERTGNRLNATPYARVDLAQGYLDAGEYPFEITLPTHAPFSYKTSTSEKEGDVSVRWAICAQLNVPWQADKIKKYSINVLPAVAQDQGGVDELARRIPKTDAGEEGTGAKLLKYGLMALFSPAIVVLSPIIAVVYARKAWTGASIRKFQLTVPEKRLALGQHVRVLVQFEIKKAVEVQDLTVRLKGVQTWTTGSGNSRSTSTHAFFETEVSILKDAVIEPGSVPVDAQKAGYRTVSGRERPKGPVFLAEAILSLPQDGAPATRSVGGTGTTYQVSAKLRLGGIPDLAETKVLKLVGARMEPVPELPRQRSFLETSGAVRLGSGS